MVESRIVSVHFIECVLCLLVCFSFCCRLLSGRTVHWLVACPPIVPQRIILANQPRVTRHEIAWDDDLTQEQRLLAEHQAAEAAQVRPGTRNVAIFFFSFLLTRPSVQW